jgi:hypothetical protein
MKKNVLKDARDNVINLQNLARVAFNKKDKKEYFRLICATYVNRILYLKIKLAITNCR